MGSLLLLVSKRGFVSLLYRRVCEKRKSLIFIWDRNSYLPHLIFPVGRIKKRNMLCGLCIDYIGCDVNTCMLI